MLISISDIILGIKKTRLFFFGLVSPLWDGWNKSVDILHLRNKSNCIYNLILIANTEQHITIPLNSRYVYINAIIQPNNCNIYSKLGNNTVLAAIPNSNIIDGTGYDINIKGYVLFTNDTTLSFIADKNTTISCAFYN